MKPARRRKTPETQIAKEIRKYARGYEAKGQQERADGMLQAADLLDDLSARGVPDPKFAEAWSDVSARLKGEPVSLEARVSALEQAVFQPNGKAKTIPLRRLPAILTPAGERRAGTPPADAAALSTGELRILSAAAQRQSRGVTSDELTALVEYRATSLRTYLGNLRAGGFVLNHKGRHYATEAGRSLAKNKPSVPFGPELFAWWLAGRLHTGEQKLLQRIAAASGPIESSDLIGESGLKATSVRTYLNSLSSRKLITRPERGKVAIAPILLEPSNEG